MSRTVLWSIWAPGNEVIDSYAFGPQSADVSKVRSSDAGATWVFFSTPTTGAPNAGSGDCCLLRGDINHDGTTLDISDLVSYMFQEGPAL